MPISQTLLDGIAGFVEEGVLAQEDPDEGDGYRNWPALIPEQLPTRGPLRALRLSWALYGRVHLADTNEPSP